MPAVGERVFVDCDVRQKLCGIEPRGDSVRVRRAASGEATTALKGFVEACNSKACDSKACNSKTVESRL